MAGQLRAKYDIIINGGGIVGFTLLNLILKSPHLNRSKVLLIEQATKPSNFRQQPRVIEESNSNTGDNTGDVKFSNRVSSITLASKLALKKMGVWDIVRPYSKDVKSIKVWNYDYSHKIVFRQNLSSCVDDKQEQDIMFSTMENNRLSSALLESIHQDPNAAEKIAWDRTLKNLEESLDSGNVDVKLHDNQTGEETNVTAPLILGCDGFKSKVRELTRMQYHEKDLKKTAVVGTVKIAEQLYSSENDVAHQKFSAEKDTVIALLPLSKDYSSFVISAPNDYACFLADCDEEAFVQELNRLLTNSENPSNLLLKGIHDIANTTYDNLHGLLQLLPPPLRPAIELGEAMDEPPCVDHVVPDSRASYPLLFGTTSPRMIASLPGLNRPQIALLGDSSHRIHPLAGQGLNLGIQDAIELVKQLEKISQSGERLFSDTNLLSKALRRFELRRQAYVVPMSAGILSMQELFKLSPSRLVSSVNKCNPVKTASVRFANGVM